MADGNSQVPLDSIIGAEIESIGFGRYDIGLSLSTKTMISIYNLYQLRSGRGGDALDDGRAGGAPSALPALCGGTIRAAHWTADESLVLELDLDDESWMLTCIRGETGYEAIVVAVPGVGIWAR